MRDTSPKPAPTRDTPTLGRNGFSEFAPASLGCCASSATERNGKFGIDLPTKEERRTTNVKSKRGIGGLWNKVIALGR
jgi:hypothetical protein